MTPNSITAVALSVALAAKALGEEVVNIRSSRTVNSSSIYVFIGSRGANQIKIRMSDHSARDPHCDCNIVMGLDGPGLANGQHRAMTFLKKVYGQ